MPDTTPARNAECDAMILLSAAIRFLAFISAARLLPYITLTRRLLSYAIIFEHCQRVMRADARG